MKVRSFLAMTVLTLMAGVVSAGLVQPAPVIINFDVPFAQGDQWTARSSDNDIDVIGCGVRVFDDGIDQFAWGFCQATDSDENSIACVTLNPNLLNAIGAIDDFSFITFSWRDGPPPPFDDPNGFDGECVRVGSSSNSFYLPDFTTNDLDSDSDSDSDSD